MSKVARGLFAFALYLFALGIFLLVAPNRFLSIFGVPKTHEVWIRLAGVLILYVATYYVQAARYELAPIFWASLPVRFALVVFFIAFVALDYVKPIAILFGVADTLGALWTLVALRSEAQGRAAEAVSDRS
jgi:hypothetical protein